MMWFFRHFWIFISYHIFLLNQVEGAIAIPPSNSAPLPLFRPSVCPSVCPSISLLTTFSGFCTFADKSLGRNGIELEMQMFPDDINYWPHFCPLVQPFGFFFSFFLFFSSKVRVGAKECGSHYWEMAVAITCGYGGYLLPLLAAHSSFFNTWTNIGSSLLRSSDINLSVISQEIPQLSITKFSLNKSKNSFKPLKGQWVNSLRPSDIIWQHRSGTTLAQVMDCCLTAPSHNLNQCWLIVRSSGIHLSAILQEIAQPTVTEISLKLLI